MNQPLNRADLKKKGVATKSTGLPSLPSKLKDGQDAGKVPLMIEARIGELAEKAPQIPARPGKSGWFESPGKPLKPARLGMTEKLMRNAKAIHAHPAEVAEVIREAEDKFEAELENSPFI